MLWCRCCFSACISLLSADVGCCRNCCFYCWCSCSKYSRELQVLTHSFQVGVLQGLASTQSFQAEVLQAPASTQSFHVEVLQALASTESFQVEALQSLAITQSSEVLQAPASTHSLSHFSSKYSRDSRVLSQSVISGRSTPGARECSVMSGQSTPGTRDYSLSRFRSKYSRH